MSGKACIFSKCAIKKILLDIYPSYPGTIKSQFSDEFGSCGPSIARTKNVCLRIAFKKNLPTEPVSSFKN
jgi:hypothetical protein